MSKAEERCLYIFWFSQSVCRVSHRFWLRAMDHFNTTFFKKWGSYSFRLLCKLDFGNTQFSGSSLVAPLPTIQCRKWIKRDYWGEWLSKYAWDITLISGLWVLDSYLQFAIWVIVAKSVLETGTIRWYKCLKLKRCSSLGQLLTVGNMTFET